MSDKEYTVIEILDILRRHTAGDKIKGSILSGIRKSPFWPPQTVTIFATMLVFLCHVYYIIYLLPGKETPSSL